MIVFNSFDSVKEYCLSPSPFPFHIHNWGSEFSEFFSLDIPYLFIRQDCDPQQDSWTTNLLCPGINISYQQTYRDYLEIWSSKSAHHQNYYDSVYLLEGELIKVIEGKRYPLTPGQFLLVNQNVLHMEEPNTRYCVLFFLISESYFKELLSLVSNTSLPDPAHKNLNQVMDMVFNERKEQHYYSKEFLSFQPHHINHITPLFSTILDELSQQSPGYEQIVQGLLCRILCHLLTPERYALSKHTLDGKNDDRIFTKISQLFEQNNGILSRKTISEELNYNHDYLNSIVKKHTGMSLKKYGQVFQLKNAAHMLSNTELSITDVIHQSGFSNRTYFYRLFTSKYGCTPKEYREQQSSANIQP